MLDAFNKLKGKPDEEQSSTVRPQPVSQPQPRSTPTVHADTTADNTLTSISAGMTIVGKIVGEGNVKVFGRIEGELRASTVLLCEGAHVEGDVYAEDLTIGGHLKGAIHASRVKLNRTAVVEGDIYHRSLAIEEDARFEGSSRREEKPTGAPRAAADGPR